MTSKIFTLLWLVLCLISVPVSAVADTKQHENKKEVKKLISNKKCNRCHDDEDEKQWEYDDGSIKNIYVDPEPFEKSVHGKQNCVACHTNVSLKKGEHDEKLPITVGCIQCHKKNLEEQKDNPDPKYKRLGIVMEQVDSYMHSVHGRPNINDQSKTNATCYDCHDAHNIGKLGSESRAEHRLKNPQVCGQCHEEEKKAYETSIHGQEILEKKNSKAAVCSDCHSTHNISSTEKDSTKLNITENCGSCHEKSLKTYLQSYHGQVSRLGYAHTAKCFDCHGSHELKKVDDRSALY